MKFVYFHSKGLIAYDGLQAGKSLAPSAKGKALKLCATLLSSMSQTLGASVHSLRR